MRGHDDIQQYEEGDVRRVQHETSTSIWALEACSTAYGKEFKRVEVFRYLGCLLEFDDNDTHAMRNNLKKAHGVLA